MGMYLSAVKKIGNNYENDYRWDNSKWTYRYDFFELLREDAIIDDKSQPYSDCEIYYRPKNIGEVRKKLHSSKFNSPIFNELLDLMEKDKNVFVKYD